MAARSIVRRLTLLFAAILSGGFLALGFYFYAATDHHFRDIDRATLDNAVGRVGYVLESGATPTDIPGLHARLDSMMVGHDRVSLRVATADGVTLAADSEIAFPEATARAALARSHVDHPTLFTWEQGGHQYRGLAARLPSMEPGPPPLQVLAALNIDHHKAFMTVVLRAGWISIVGAIAVSILVSIFIVRSGMQPLHKLASQVDAISSKRLKERIAIDDLPVELTGLANAFNAMLARLDTSFARLSEFSADIAHELRTPVSNLLTQTQVMLARQRSVEEYRDVLASNAEELERLSRMVSDMLFLAKADNARELAHRELVDVAREVRELFEFYEALAAEKSVGLRLSGDLTVSADRAMLRRALNNLLSNAIRYTDSGERVEVFLERDREKAVIRVSNPGPPIPETVRDRLFERFYRADEARSRDTEGAGLGLAIVNAIARSHGGGVSVSSSGGSNIFAIWIPLDSAGNDRT
jgi:two-component system heavy metal sensor histidine kinase CusS